jgi:hypothetical protein
MIPIAKNQEHKSDLVKAIEGRPRPSKILDVNMAVGILDKPIHKIAFRVNVKAEDNDAIDRAHRYVNARMGSEDARKDVDVLTDAKLIAALWAACREVKVTLDELGAVVKAEETAYPAFPAPEWMHEHLTTDQIAVLVNLYNAVRYDLSPLRVFDRDLADMLLRAAGGADEESVPTALFAPMTRDALASVLVYAALCLAGSRAALAEAEKQPEGFRLVDVEMAALTLQERATNGNDPAALARGQAMLDAVAVLRCERNADTLLGDAA